MSDAERDAMVMEAIGGSEDDLTVSGDDAKPDEEYVTREEFEKLRSTVKHLVRTVESMNSDRFAGLNTLEKYTRMVEDGEEVSLSASDVRAVAIHRHWDTLAERFANGHYGISTRKKSAKKNGPSKLKVDLQNILGVDLQNTQIYRAMKRTAELSGGSVEPDEYGRMHVVGGIYEYHEKTSPDSTDHTTYKVLIET